MNQYLCPLNKQLIVSALSPNRTDITVTKVLSYGNGIDVFKIVKWVVKNRYNQTVFLFQRENLKKSSSRILEFRLEGDYNKNEVNPLSYINGRLSLLNIQKKEAKQWASLIFLMEYLIRITAQILRLLFQMKYEEDEEE